MKKITKYIAKDATEFFTEKKCIKHENMLSELEKIMHNLSLVKVKKSKQGFETIILFKYDKESFDKCKFDFLKFCQEYVDSDFFKRAIELKDTMHPSHITYILSECKIGCIYEAWTKFLKYIKNIHRGR